MISEGHQRESRRCRSQLKLTIRSPAELLQKFAILDVEQQLAQHPSRKNRSPLTVSFTEVNEESDGGANGSTASPENRPRNAETYSSVM